MTHIYEIHITVETDDEDTFVSVCNNNGIKPIVIEYETFDKTQVMHDVMTSQHVTGFYQDAWAEINRIVDVLDENDMKPKRIKIETTPFNPMVKSCISGYFESHLAIQVPVERETDFRILSDSFVFEDGNKMHASKNAFKKGKTTNTIMITHRRYHQDYDAFLHEVHEGRDVFINAGFDVDRVIVEYCVYDNNVFHDDAWLKSS